MQLYAWTAGLLLPMLIEAQSLTKNSTTAAQTISSMPGSPTTELGQRIESVLSLVFLITSMGYMFLKGGVWLIQWILWPAIALWNLLFQACVYGPYKAVTHIVHVLYPVATFCFAAACFGIVIGGFAGIASEAISTFFISITWGSSTTKTATGRSDTAPPLTRRPVTDRLMEFGRRASRDLIPSGISSSASSMVEHGYFGEWANRRPQQSSVHGSDDVQEDEEGRSETSWDNEDDDDFTAHPTARPRR